MVLAKVRIVEARWRGWPNPQGRLKYYILSSFRCTLIVFRFSEFLFVLWWLDPDIQGERPVVKTADHSLHKLIELLNPRKDARQHAVPICRWLHHKAAGHWLRQFEVHSAWLHLSLVAKLQVIDSPQAESLAKQAWAVVMLVFFDVSFMFLHIYKQVDPQDPPPAGGCWGAWHHQVE